jgi:secreted trypsin-like serine protease
MYKFLALITAFPLCKSSNTSSAVENRIFKGYDVEMHQYPFAVFLNFQNTRPTSCGATLIMVQAVLTAAHCVDEIKYNKGRIDAFFGAPVPRDSKVVRRVVDVRIHPKYRETNGRNNLAVAFLNSRVPLSRNIKKIPIADNEPLENSAVFSAGWGRQKVSLST